MMRSSNPVLKNQVFSSFGGSIEDRMTVNGTIHKTGLAILILIATALYAWSQAIASLSSGIPSGALGLLPVGLIGGLVLAIITSFKPSAAPYTVPFYAACEGLVLGALSAVFEQRYPGIVSQAVFATFGTLVALLLAYRSGLIRATERFKLGVFAATGGLAIFYFISMISSFFFHAPMAFMYGSSPLSIGISAFAAVIAALNLVIDFDFIEQGALRGAPKYMEWYGAFGLLVTLVWLYMELLRLLSKARDRR